MMDLARVESDALYRAERRRLRAGRRDTTDKAKRQLRFASKLRRRIATGHR